MIITEPEAFLENPAVVSFIQQAKRRRFPAKQTILHQGDPAASVYLILKGSASILAEHPDGRQLILAYKHPGEFVGEMCLFPHLENRSAIVRTRSELWVAEMGYSDFRRFSRDCPDIIFLLAGQLAAGLRDTSRRLADLNFLDVSGRIARTLLALTRKPDASHMGNGALVRISRQEIAKIAGCSREMAGRVLKSLEEDGLIRINGQRIFVLSFQRTDDKGSEACSV